jgi:Trm5-related predicted tRNA methylase
MCKTNITGSGQKVTLSVTLGEIRRMFFEKHLKVNGITPKSIDHELCTGDVIECKKMVFKVE